MCRSIKVLRHPQPGATREEMEAAALQYVRKVSGFHKPSKVNTEAFERAVKQVADATEVLLHSIQQAAAASR